MPWLELSVRCNRREWNRIESALEEIGALSVTLLDAEDSPILEPGPGETPLWPDLVALAMFDLAIDQRGLTAVLQELVPWLDEDRLSFREIADADWTRAWMDQFQPMRFGRRLWIYPSTVEPLADDPEAVIVHLDPGLAFGTGTHATTALCLAWLDGLDLAGRTVLDYGCGSGVLAIAALKLGAARAIGVDNDPQAIDASRDNAARNAVADRFEACSPDELAAEPFEVVVANILAGALIALAPRLARLTAPGGRIALSGVLDTQVDEVRAAYAGAFDALSIEIREAWVRLDGTRTSISP